VEIIVLLHRIYSFPFAWAACFGHLLYKRESFSFLTREYGNLFPQADVLHGRASELFHTWDIPCAAFMEAQGELDRSGPSMDEAAMSQLEPAAWSRIRSFVTDLEEEGMLEVFNNHLDIAEGYLMDGVSQMEYRAHLLSSVQRIFPAAISTEACFG